jgi:hypothetical protein
LNERIEKRKKRMKRKSFSNKPNLFDKEGEEVPP